MSIVLKVGEPFSPRKLFYGPTIPLGILSDPDLSDGAKLAWGRIAMYQGEKTTCVPSAERLAADLGWSIPSAKRALVELTQKKLIERRQRGRGKSAETSLIWHPKLEKGLRQAGSVLIQQESQKVAESDIQAVSDLSQHEKFKPYQICTQAVSKLDRLAGSNLYQPIKEEKNQLEKNQQRESAAAAEDSGYIGELDAAEEPAAADLFFSEIETPALTPEVVDASGKEQTQTISEEDLAKVREACNTATVKIINSKHPAGMVEIAAKQGLTVDGLLIFIAWKGKRAETSSLLLRALAEDIEQFKSSKEFKRGLFEQLVWDELGEAYKKAALECGKCFGGKNRETFEWCDCSEGQRIHALQEPHYFVGTKACIEPRCKATLRYRTNQLPNHSYCAFCARPDWSTDLNGLAEELGAVKPFGPCSQCQTAGYVELDNNTAEARAEWCTCAHSDELRKENPEKVERVTEELREWHRFQLEFDAKRKSDFKPVGPAKKPITKADFDELESASGWD